MRAIDDVTERHANDRLGVGQLLLQRADPNGHLIAFRRGGEILQSQLLVLKNQRATLGVNRRPWPEPFAQAARRCAKGCHVGIHRAHQNRASMPTLAMRLTLLPRARARPRSMNPDQVRSKRVSRSTPPSRVLRAKS